MKKMTFFFFAIAVTLIAIGQNNKLNVEVYILDNGLTVYLHPDEDANSVFGCVVVKAGGKNDPADATGLAHYQEHMLFKGTEEIGTTNWEAEKKHIDKIFQLYDQLSQTTDDEERKKIQLLINQESVEANKYAIPGEFDKILKNIGSTSVNASTSTDMTVYFNKFPVSQIEKWLEIYSHRFIAPVFRGFQAELEVVYEEYNMYNDVFIMPLIEKFSKNFFKTHPYGQQSIIGTYEHLKNPSLTKMYDFFKTYYVANNIALVLSGNFETNEIKPMINKYFSRLESKEIPEMPVYEENTFNGREEVNVKMSPIKIGFLGFRTPPANHPDQIVLTVLYRLLTNSSQIGLLDKLALDNKLMAAVVIPMPYVDHGALLILVIPKIIGQSLEEAEELVLAELNKIKTGEIDDDLIESIKKELYVEQTQSLESSESVIFLLAKAFVEGQTIEELNKELAMILEITKEDIQKAAQKYFSDNYLAFFSKMGFPKKEKIEKPGYEPLLSNVDVKSEYFEKIENMPTKQFKSDYNFYDKVIVIPQKNNANLYYTNNPKNDIFSFIIKLYPGSLPDKLTELAYRGMNYSGTKEHDVNTVKRNFALLGVNYYFYFEDNIATIKLEGLEENLERGLLMLKELLYSAQLDETKIKVLYEEEKAIRKLESAEADNIADALYDYVLYGNHSEFIHRPKQKEIKKLKPETLLEVFTSSLNYPVEYHYTGQKDPKEISEYINRFFYELKSQEKIIPYQREIKQHKENTVYYTHKKNTIQSKIYFHLNGGEYIVKIDPAIDLFNTYFGGGLSGLVFIEIRELRSLAYAAGATVHKPKLQNKNFILEGFIGTQADKTDEAISVFTELINNMPHKPEETKNLINYLQLSLDNKIPNFRNITQSYVYYKRQGFEDDPLTYKSKMYETMNFSDIVDFHETYIKNKPLGIIMVADKKRIDRKSLEKFGKLNTIKPKSIFTK